MGVEPEPIARTRVIYDVELNTYRRLFILADRRLPMDTDALYSDEPGGIYIDEGDDGVLLAEIASMRIWVERRYRTRHVLNLEVDVVESTSLGSADFHFAVGTVVAVVELADDYRAITVDCLDPHCVAVCTHIPDGNGARFAV